MQEFSVPFICSECKRNFRLTGRVVRKESIIVENELIDFFYFDCGCGKRYFVQVDNGATKEVLNNLILVIAKITASKSEGKGVKRKYSARYKVLSGQLKRMRFELMKKYEGKVYFDNALKKNVEIHFSS